jgi:uncharacterized protein (UPF0212 family)
MSGTVTPLGSIHCPSCRAEIACVQMSDDALVRCSCCGNVFETSVHNTASKLNPRAMISFALGLCSLGFLMLTGIPAIMMGLRSLKQIRQSEQREHGKWMSYCGIAMGSVFGIGFGSLALVALYASLLVYFSSESGDDQASRREILSQVIDVQLPDDLELSQAGRIIGIIITEGNVPADEGTEPATTFRLVNFPKWFPVSAQQLLSQEMAVTQSLRGRVVTHQHTKELLGQDRQITQLDVYSSDGTSLRYSKYFCIANSEFGLYAIQFEVRHNPDQQAQTPPEELPKVSNAGNGTTSQSVALGKGESADTNQSSRSQIVETKFSGRVFSPSEILDIFESMRLPK